MASASKINTTEAVESLIQYKFTNTDLLWEALHTRGIDTGVADRIIHRDGNLRLAIVGDAVIHLCLAEDWFADGQFTIHFAQGVARNSNLNKIGRELGLERFINVGGGGWKVEITGKKMADTIEAILGAIYLDSGREKAKDVMDALGLLPKEQLLERQFEAEGLVMLEPEDAEDSKGKGKKRRKSDAS